MFVGGKLNWVWQTKKGECLTIPVLSLIEYRRELVIVVLYWETLENCCI